MLNITLNAPLPMHQGVSSETKSTTGGRFQCDNTKQAAQSSSSAHCVVMTLPFMQT